MMLHHSIQVLKLQVGWYSLVCVNSLCCSMTKLDPYCNAYDVGTPFLELCVNSRCSTTTLQDGGIMWRVISCGIWHQCCDVCYMGTLFLEFAQSHAYIVGISYEHCKLSHGIHAAIYATWGHCSWCSWWQFALSHGTLL